MKVRDLARGKWKEILPLFVSPSILDGKHHPCPKSGGKDRFRYSDVAGLGNYFCACSNGEGDGFCLAQCLTGMTFTEVAERIEDHLGEKGEREQREPSWAERLQAEVITSTRSQYLARRGLEVAPGLRWHKSLPYYVDGKEAGRYPAMMAPVVKAGKFVTYHVTYLDGGKKADVEPARKILPGNVAGGAVPLYPAGSVLGIAEGVETAIAAKMLFDVPVWSALNTSGMSKWVCPIEVETVIIFADNDLNYAGHAAAFALAHKLVCLGKKVEVRMPDQPGDWNDVLLKQREAA
jgi:putative DNA primase/helicase